MLNFSTTLDYFLAFFIISLSTSNPLVTIKTGISYEKNLSNTSSLSFLQFF